MAVVRLSRKLSIVNSVLIGTRNDRQKRERGIAEWQFLFFLHYAFVFD